MVGPIARRREVGAVGGAHLRGGVGARGDDGIALLVADPDRDDVRCGACQALQRLVCRPVARDGTVGAGEANGLAHHEVCGFEQPVGVLGQHRREIAADDLGLVQRLLAVAPGDIREEGDDDGDRQGRGRGDGPRQARSPGWP
jgi:hypothetical protein